MPAVLSHLLLTLIRQQHHISRNALPSIQSFGLVQGCLAAESGCIMGCKQGGFSAFSMQHTHADLALQDEDREEYDDDEEAEEVDEDDMGDDGEEEEEEEEDEEEERDGLAFINPYHGTYQIVEDDEEEDEEDDDDDDEEEEGAEGLLEVDCPGASWDHSEHMVGSGSPATRARRMELAGKPAFCCC